MYHILNLTYFLSSCQEIVTSLLYLMNVRGAMNCATMNGMKSGAEIILSNLDREVVNDAGGLDADMDDAFYCGD